MASQETLDRLRALRKKHGLGEFKSGKPRGGGRTKPKRRPTSKRPARHAKRPRGNPDHGPTEPPDDLGSGLGFGFGQFRLGFPKVTSAAPIAAQSPPNIVSPVSTKPGGGSLSGSPKSKR